MHDLNDALDELRSVIPYAHSPSVRKLSKIATLLLAKNYILMQGRRKKEGREACFIFFFFFAYLNRIVRWRITHVAGNALEELKRVIAVLQSPHAHTTALPPTPVSYDLLHGFPGKLFQGVPDMQGLPTTDPQSVTAGGPPTDGTVASGESN